jgi:hypothetical protein
MMFGRLKLCNSPKVIDDIVDEDIKKHLAKCKREAKKEEAKRVIEEELAAVQEEENVAGQVAAAAVEQQESLRKEKESIKSQAPTEFEGVTQLQQTQKKAEELHKKEDKEKNLQHKCEKQSCRILKEQQGFS